MSFIDILLKLRECSTSIDHFSWQNRATQQRPKTWSVLVGWWIGGEHLKRYGCNMVELSYHCSCRMFSAALDILFVAFGWLESYCHPRVLNFRMLQVPYGDTYATHRRQHLLDMLTSGETPASKEHFKEAYFVSNALPGSQNRTTPEDTGALSRLGVRLLGCLHCHGLLWKVERLACQIFGPMVPIFVDAFPIPSQTLQIWIG